jgi:membrane protease YdiL (CAAX protease family)
VIERTATVLLVFLDLLRRAVFADERRSSGRLLNLRSFGVRHLDFDLRLLGFMFLSSVLLLLFFRGSLTTQTMSEERP